ncbi:hypothetical protein HZR84_03165 [Hyphobacterium sp. CCMP332]|nr:hypothetical protein HZR84_03165 [Hyphobacterium sp. CCMP332]
MYKCLASFISTILIGILSVSTYAQQRIVVPDFHFENTTKQGNTWSLDIRNINFEYKFPQYVTSRTDKSTLTGGFADEGSVNIDVKYSPVQFINWNGQNIPLSDIKGSNFFQFSVGNFKAEIFSGNRLIKSTDLSTQGGMFGKLNGDNTQNAIQPVSWKTWLGVSTMEEVNKIFDGGLNLKNVKFDISFSSWQIDSYIDKMAKEQGLSNQTTNTQYTKESPAGKQSNNSSSSSVQNQSEKNELNDSQTLITGSKSPTERTKNQYEYNRQREIEAWNRNYERETREFSEAFSRRQEEALIMRQKKDQMVDQAARNIANVIIQIQEQKERERLQAKSNKIRRTLDEIVITVERFGEYHQKEIMKIREITAKHSANLSLQTLRKAEKELDEAYEDKLQPVDDFIKDFEKRMEDMRKLDMMDDPDYFPLSSFEYSLESFLNENRGYYDYGIPNILREARRDLEENPKAEPYYTELSRIHIPRLIKNCKYSDIKYQVSTLMRINQSAGESYTYQLEKALTIADGKKAISEENMRRKKLYESFQNDYAKVKVQIKNNPNNIYSYNIGKTIDPSFDTPSDQLERIKKANSIIGQCASSNGLNARYINPKDFKNNSNDYQLVEPGNFTIHAKKRYHFPIDTFITVKAPESYLISPNYWVYREHPLMKQFTSVRKQYKPNKDVGLQDQAFYGFLSPNAKWKVEYAVNGHGHNIQIPFINLYAFKPYSMVNSPLSFYYGVGLDLNAGISNTNITRSESVIGKQSATKEEKWSRFGGGAKFEIGFVSYILPRLSLDIDANAFIDFNGLTFYENIQYTFANENSITENKIFTGMVMAAINPNIGFNYQVGASTLYIKYGINYFILTEIIEDELTDSPSDIEQERLANILSNFPKDNLNAFIKFGIIL